MFVIPNAIIMETNSLLLRIIEKGAVMGRLAKLYENDKVKADLFIKKCAKECHRKSAKNLWGGELISDILEYSKPKINNKHLVNYDP